MTEPRGKVLVTGGTGFLGGWCAAELVRRGYEVRTTLRNLARADDVRASLAAAGVEAGDRLSFAAADLGADDGWSEAVAGCDHVLHVASPFPPAQPKDPDELIVPARDGALRVIRAGLDAGVQRIVMTSSVAAVRHGRPPSAAKPYDETDWTDPDDLRRTPYVRSKTIAERAAWEEARARGAEERLAVVNPGAIIGPVLSDDRSFSLQVVERLLNGMPAMPRLGFVLVDVRDVADLHIRAMTDPAAGGQRFLAVDRFSWMKEVGEVLRERLGDQARKVPTRVAPDLLIRAMGLFDPSVRSIVGDLGQSTSYTAQKAKTTLGWETRPTADSIADTAQSLIARGLAG
ncbi:MAG TPA: NAD-dependent epimerase/dehydratase family protein [Solirubrobacteraceae bacterium]|nr:NAD-dependent epimerase/dehydratase family protein [Solirubrobacteraceae bacterium]